MKKNKGTELSDDNLDKVAGGFAYRDPGWFWQSRFMFTDDEVEEIKRKKGISLEANKEYCTGDLKDKGLIDHTSGSDLRDKLKKDFGFSVTHF